MLSGSPQDQARQLTARGAALLQENRDEAERLYLEAVRLDPELDAAWFDLGLIYKWSHEWDKALRCSLRAAEIVGEVNGEPAWWNLGIAATALHRWEVARRAWQVFGIPLPDGSGPIHANLGPGVVRLNPQGHAEVVWGRRLDPARIQLENIPFPESGHRWRDIVLHDGEPKGQREWDGRQYAVFDEIELWAPSDAATLCASVSARTVDDYESLIAALHGDGHMAEDWTANVRLLCKRCSEGTPHPEHSADRLASGREHLVGIAGHYEQVEGTVATWASVPGRQLHALDLRY